MRLPLYNYFLLASLLAGVTVYFQNNTPRYLKLYPIFLLLTVVEELFGLYLAQRTGSNTILYNFYNIIQFGFYFFVLKEIVANPKIKRLILLILYTFVVFAVINIVFIQKVKNWNSVSYAFGSLITVALVIYYFFELFKQPKATNLIRDPAFWICTGLLFFFCCSFPFFGLANLLTKAPAIIIRNLQGILTLINISLYLLITIAFLCRLRFNKVAKKA